MVVGQKCGMKACSTVGGRFEHALGLTEQVASLQSGA